MIEGFLRLAFVSRRRIIVGRKAEDLPMGYGSDGSHEAPVTSQPSCYSMGDLLIDVGRRRVSRYGQEIRLGKVAFDLLVALMTAAPEVVSVAALMQQVWPGSLAGREIVGQRVAALRAALEGDPKAARYIEGVRGRGYRLVAELQPVVSSEAQTGPNRLRAALRWR